MPDIFGPPPKPATKTREERAQEGMAAATRALRNLLGGKRAE
jgi:hypothetical protein